VVTPFGPGGIFEPDESIPCPRGIPARVLSYVQDRWRYSILIEVVGVLMSDSLGIKAAKIRPGSRPGCQCEENREEDLFLCSFYVQNHER
jgi:hypothetical protein